MSYKPFIITDPTPWLDQLIETHRIMVSRCGGTSVEFSVRSMLQGCKSQDGLMLAACEEGNPGTLVAWLSALYVHDSLEPWVEVWGFWCKPGLAQVMRELGGQILFDWARSKGAKKILAVLTRNPKVFLKMFHEMAGFEQVGIVIERKL